MLYSFLSVTFTGSIQAEPVKIGVLAFRSQQGMQQQWQPLTRMLKTAIPEHDFVIEALSHNELEMAVFSRQIDFILTSPAHYIQIAHHIGLSSPLATLINSYDDKGLAAFGGVIFSLKTRNDIQRLADIRGKNVAAVGQESLGGYHLQIHELQKAGLKAGKNYKIQTTGTPHDKVVEAVLSGKADAGFVRTGVLESLAQQGKLDINTISIINNQDLPDFPLFISTRLFPEWPFASLPQIDEKLARRVTAALFMLSDHSDVSRSIGIQGFTVPADYLATNELLRELRAPPYENLPGFTLNDVWRRYNTQILAILFTAACIIALGIALIIANRRLRVERKNVLQQTIKLQESEALWKFALEGAGDGVWDWHIPTGQVFFSKQWKAMIGYAEDEFENTFDSWKDHLHPDDSDRVLATVHNYFEKNLPLYTTEFRIRSKNGEWHWILSRGMVVSYSESNEPLRMIGTHTDINERKQAEFDLRKSNADLEQFAYSVSHDLRQPLRMVTGHLQLVEKHLDAVLNNDDRENMNFALQGAKRMDAMIVSLLEYSRVGRKSAPKSKHPSQTALDNALFFLVPARQEAHAEITISGEWPEIIASQDEMTRLFLNLTSNAIKYRNKEQPPIIHIHGHMENTIWRVTISDNGIGIIPSQIPRLFQFFSRLQSRAKFEGTGMGLALCRKIVEHHEGRIWAESEGEGKGSRFIFEIPVKTSETA
ncbi:PhnD/SsuA/transferrin family substrate-binding protein [Methylicorpusculum oleiharenae]|uniref:PhnD/SsuA/transferrin family substrate-binding protein n=1 Tax=Methylicorpusculum oleiharenae TaxID=1338687 RepID=UPI001357FBCA|nr:PhnD/SsuA/transferrin family substrate-binding protein [Methylicorpusculum oleiharenae]MCD2450963.1 PhnD/SsuA/transferrin family substrate-binding protein [Methylicorpusculum oleiharenae]